MVSGRYLIGRYAVDFDAAKVSIGGQWLSLHWRGLEALREMAATPGQVVPRDRLFQVLWPGAVVDESNLGKVISQLRRTLDENDPGTEHIETLPGAGYRLVAPVRPLEVEDRPGTPTAERTPGRSGRWKFAIALALVLTPLCAAGAWWWTRPDLKMREAEQAIARGKELLRARDPSRALEALALLRRATELNPGSAVAFAALAHALNKQGADLSGQLGMGSPALEAAARSVELDPSCAECNGTLGLFLLSHGWQWERSRLQLEKAVQLNPADFNIRPSYALALLVNGQPAGALEQIDIALAAAPFHAGYLTIRARVLYFLGRYEESAEAADRALTIQPDELGGWDWKSQALIQMGRVREGVEAITGRRYREHAAPALEAAQVGGLKPALRILIQASGNDWHHSWRRARWKAMIGDRAGAIAELQTAAGKRQFEAMFIALEPVFEPIRGEPEFQRLVEGMGLRLASP